LREVLEPLLKEIESLNEGVKEYDARMEKIARESYPQVALLKQALSRRGLVLLPTGPRIIIPIRFRQ
jgi:hypothetical protein